MEKLVTLSNNDIINLSNYLSKNHEELSQGNTEYFIKEWVKRIKSVDFFICDMEQYFNEKF